MNLKEFNSLGQKVSKATKTISDINAVNEARKGNIKPVKRKIKNKVKNKVWRILNG